MTISRLARRARRLAAIGSGQSVLLRRSAACLSM
jgi:hypothetical protein